MSYTVSMRILIVVISFFLVGCFPALKTPGELAARYKCDPWMISGWEGGAIEYRSQDNYDNAATVMQRRWGDCKGYAMVAYETLSFCGLDAHIVILEKEEGPRHAITTFTFPDGRRGFINAGQSGIYPLGTSWDLIFSDVDFGKWAGASVEEL